MCRDRSVQFSSKVVARFFFLALLILPLFNANAIAGEYSIFGPRIFLRGSGAPIIETDTIIATPGNQYQLKISNGGLDDDEYELVSSSVITLNGVEILSPNELNQQTTYIEKTVTLQQINAFSVEVRGKPGGALIINIDGVDNTLPTINATTSPQANTAGWNNTDVNVAFDCADSLSGIASCSPPVTVSLEGAAQIVTGTAVDNADNIAETNVTLNIDKSLPVITLTNPLNNALLTAENINVTGNINDSGSAVSATLNGQAITLQNGGDFSQAYTLVEGVNLLTIVATVVV